MSMSDNLDVEQQYKNLVRLATRRFSFYNQENYSYLLIIVKKNQIFVILA